MRKISNLRQKEVNGEQFQGCVNAAVEALLILNETACMAKCTQH